MAKRILVVDDSQSMRTVVRLTLESAGFGVIEACDGLEACEKLGQGSVDLVLSDVSMPRLDGLGMLKRIRSNADGPMPPVLMLTTETNVVRKEEFRRAGAKAWLVKPIPPAQLLDAVRRFAA